MENWSLHTQILCRPLEGELGQVTIPGLTDLQVRHCTQDLAVQRAVLHQSSWTLGVLEPDFRGESESDFCLEGGQIFPKLFGVFLYVTPKLRFFELSPLNPYWFYWLITPRKYLCYAAIVYLQMGQHSQPINCQNKNTENQISQKCEHPKNPTYRNSCRGPGRVGRCQTMYLG